MRVARVAVLGIAIVAGGIAAFLAYRAPEPTAPPPPPPVAIDTVKILVAARNLSIGQVVSAQEMEWREWPKASTTSQDVLETVQPNAIKLFEGQMARVPIQAGWPMWISNLIDAKLKVSSAGYIAAKLSPGKRAVSVEIAPDTAAGGTILPNDHVDVIHSYKDRLREKITGVETYVSSTVLADIPVLAIDQTFEEKPGVQTQLGRTATLELDPLEAEELTRARMDGKISLSLRSLRQNGPDAVARNTDVPDAPDAPVAPVVPNFANVCRPLLCDREPERISFASVSPRCGPLGCDGTGSNPGSHYVQPHYNSNGTYTQGRYQTNPNSTQYDNYSTKGNVNPYTGAKGTRNPKY